MALDSRIRHTLNIGLGSASTLKALASYQSIETLDVVEISGAVARASALFEEGTVLADSRTRLVVEDVSHFLLTGHKSYDLIVSDGKQGFDFSGKRLTAVSGVLRACAAASRAGGHAGQQIPMATPKRTCASRCAPSPPSFGVRGLCRRSALDPDGRLAQPAGQPAAPERRRVRDAARIR
jgi:hypothetical protein